jgi:geranylgeranyl pyrophosphate synthase
MAILAGDGLQAEAFALLAREPEGQHPTLMSRKLRALGVVAAAAGAAGMVGGQAIDLDAVKPTIKPFTPDSLRDMHARKTGALIRASVASGAIMAGASDSLFAAIDQYGKEIGLAFQIVDDILDEEGSSATLGKTAGKDKAAGKPTYPALFGLERSKALAAECQANANAALERAGLLDSRLADIARWIIDRRS